VAGRAKVTALAWKRQQVFMWFAKKHSPYGGSCWSH